MRYLRLPTALQGTLFWKMKLSATLLCRVRYNFVEKDEFLMEYFKLVHAPPWKIP